MSGDRYLEEDLYSDSAYTADISTRMRVPDRSAAAPPPFKGTVS